MKYLVLFFVTLSASAAQTDNRLEALREANPRATPYQLLQQLYGESKEPAKAADFGNSAQAASNLICLVAEESTDRGELTNSNLTITRNAKEIPPVPAQGPLFPAEPARVIDKNCLLVLNNIAQAFNYGDEVCRNSGSATTATDLVITETSSIMENSTWITSLRKNGELVSFKLVTKPQTESAPVTTYFGYCYRQ